MADKFSKEVRSKIMRSIRSKNTKPELIIRRTLFSKGHRFRIHYGAEKIDIAFPKRKIAIFADGCFWHSCPRHGNIPELRKTYWIPKLNRNIERANDKDKRLKKEGWKVIHVWEHETGTVRQLTKKLRGEIRFEKQTMKNY